MMIWLYIAAGSALGGVSRYAVAVAMQQRFGLTFPIGTLLINVTGSFLLGVIMRHAMGGAMGGTQLSSEMRLFLATGFCGGFTTFSTFSFETVFMLESGEYGRATMYVVLSIVLSLAAAFLGFGLAQSALGFRGRV